MGIERLQNAADNVLKPKRTRTSVEHPLLLIMLLRFAAMQDEYTRVDPGSTEARSLNALAGSHAVGSGVRLGLMESELVGSLNLETLMPAAVCEAFGSRLAARAGLRAGQVRLSLTAPSGEKGYVKCRGTGIAGMGVWIESLPIENGMPVYYLNLEAATPFSSSFDRIVPGLFREIDHRLCTFVLRSLNKPTFVLRSEYDFPKELETSPAVLEAVRWNSDARLLHTAFRALLYMSYLHNSNLICTTGGDLVQIDFEKIIVTPGVEDLIELHSAVKNSPRLMRICGEVSRLGKSDIFECLTGIDDLAAIESCYWRSQETLCNDPESAAEYIWNRLKYWRALFPVAARQAA